MANQQVTKQSTVVVLTVAPGTGAGTAQPIFSGSTNFNLYLGTTKVIPDTLLTSLPITVNGFTVSAQTLGTGGPPPYTSLSIAVAPSSTLVAATGYILNANSPGGPSVTGTFDLVTSGGGGGGGGASAPTTAPIITATSGAGGNSVGTGAVAIPAGLGISFFRSATSGATGGTLIYALTYSATSQPALSFVDNTAPVGTIAYYYAVYTNGAGVGPASNVTNATATATTSSTQSGTPSNIATATPSAPVLSATTLIATAGNAQVLLQWTNPAQLSAVNVLRRVSVAAGATLNAFTTITNLIATTVGTPSTVPTFYLDSTVTNGITYDYEVVTLP